MKELCTLGLLLLLAIRFDPAAAQEAEGAWKPAQLIGARERIVHSRETGRDYRIQIAAVGQAPAKGYPVLYVLDGDGVFPFATLLAQSMSMSAEDHQAVPLLIVGVGYPNGQLLDLAARAEDYTPASDNYDNAGDKLSRRFGGADAFARFLKGPLREAVAAEFPVNAGQQSLFGHSYGGLFALHQLLTQPEGFRHYLISSPSIWWNQQRVLQGLDGLGKRLATINPGPSVHISAAEYEQSLPPHLSQSPRLAMMKQRRMVDAMREAATQIQQQGGPELKLKQQVYPGQTHGTAMVYALTDGIKWLYAQCRADKDCI